MSKKNVSEDAVLECQLGTEQSFLKVPESHGISSQGRNAANIADNVVDYNIFNFCKCKREIPPVPCTPVIKTKWLKGKEDCILGTEPILMEDCIIPCCYGGIIRIVKCGQNE